MNQKMEQRDSTRDRNVVIIRVKIKASNSKADTSFVLTLSIMVATYIRTICDITSTRC